MARDYIGYGIRARAQGLITRELGPESELEKVQRLYNEVGQERFTLLDRALLARAKGGILAVTTEPGEEPWKRTTRLGRLKTLECPCPCPNISPGRLKIPSEVADGSETARKWGNAHGARGPEELENVRDYRTPTWAFRHMKEAGLFVDEREYSSSSERFAAARNRVIKVLKPR